MGARYSPSPPFALRLGGLRSGTATLPESALRIFGAKGVPPKLAKRRGTMYYVYILKLINNTFYTGYSANLRQRIKEHTEGKIVWTRKLIPLKLVFYAAFSSKKRALDFEKYLKSFSGFAFRNKRLI